MANNNIPFLGAKNTSGPSLMDATSFNADLKNLLGWGATPPPGTGVSPLLPPNT